MPRRKKAKRDPAKFDVFKMRPRGRPGPKVAVFRDKKGRFIEVMKVDDDVNLSTKKRGKK